MANIKRPLKAIFDFDSRPLEQKKLFVIWTNLLLRLSDFRKNTKGDRWCPFMFKEMDCDNFITYYKVKLVFVTPNQKFSFSFQFLFGFVK